MATASQRWNLRVSEVEVVAEYDIRGATTKVEALNADQFPRLNDGSVGGGLKAEYPSVERRGPASSQLWLGVVRWTQPTFGDSHQDPVGDPLVEPALYSWGRTTISYPADFSTDGYPLVNAAGDAFDPPGTRDIIAWTLEVQKNFAFYDYETFAAYQGALNADVMTLNQPDGKTVVFLPGTMKCNEIIPAAYRADATYVTIIARFEILRHWDFINTATFTQPQLERLSPFHAWRVNEGYYGWYAEDDETKQRGPIIGGNREWTTMPVRLTASGKPMNAQYKIQGPGKTAKTPVDFQLTNVDPVSGLTMGPPGGIAFDGPGSASVLLCYRNHHALSFGTLPIWT